MIKVHPLVIAFCLTALMSGCQTTSVTSSNSGDLADTSILIRNASESAIAASGRMGLIGGTPLDQQAVADSSTEALAAIETAPDVEAEAQSEIDIPVVDPSLGGSVVSADGDPQKVSDDTDVTQAGFQSVVERVIPPPPTIPALTKIPTLPAIPSPAPQEIEPLPVAVPEAYPIDLSSALRLAGADNWSVKIASQRVREAAAEYCQAKSAWIPSLTIALGYNHHEGELQATEGDVLTVSRNSLFLGAGAGVANSPLNGGSGGPPRMFVDFSFADAIFQPLAASRVVGAEQARQNRVINDTMLKTSLAYYELVRAQSKLANAQQNHQEAKKLATLTEAFTEAGKGTLADNSRIAVVLNNRKNALAMAESDVKVASAKLATILQLDPCKLDPTLGLVALEVDPLPVQLTDANFDLPGTIAQAQSVRCELAEANARTRAAQAEHCAERWRPWLPNLYAGYSGGLFGGGPGSDLSSLDGRSDLDVVVSWQVKNLGFGSRAQQDSARSRVHQRNLEARQVKDQIAEQVTSTYYRVQQFQSMVEVLRESVDESGSGLDRNLVAIKGLEGLPLEAIASLEQLATARNEYVDAVVNYNQWQFRLLRAAGQSLVDGAAPGEVMGCDVSGCSACEPTCSNCISKPKCCQ